MERIRLKGLSGEMIQHPLDRGAISDLMKKLEIIPGLDKLLSEAISEIEKELYLLNLADNTLLSRKQCAAIHDLLEGACSVLDMEPVSLFLDTNPIVNAWSYGERGSGIVITTAMVDACTTEELLAAFGHELGHIKCRHTFYRIVAERFDLLERLVSLIPWVGKVIALGIRLPLLDWYRKSELTADRAALLVTGNVRSVVSLLQKLAGGTSSLREQLTTVGFIDQAEKFLETYNQFKRDQGTSRVSGLWSDFIWASAASTHPWPAVRVREISTWGESEDYRAILSGDLEKALSIQRASADPGKEGEKKEVPGDDAFSVIKDRWKSLFRPGSGGSPDPPKQK